MLLYLSNKIAVYIKNVVPDHPASVAVLRYSLSFILNTVLIILLTLGMSFVTGRTKEAVIILTAFALLRQVSGGIHLKSGDLCIIVTSAAFTIMSLIDLGSEPIFLLNLFSLLLVLLFSPSRIDRQTRIPKKYYPLLKIISAAFVLTNFYWASATLAITFFAQAATLIRLKGGEQYVEG
ncbi:accessory gene regulator B [Paenibacillus cellulosilyticus]|uniref:Accessory gene regulator B n=1 Tax=Paenibacillus cellulosilyticus TaxID=375489 RepID=A0A2V2YGL9_9BACL|nr:accessory gene regulator B family protein [Paenibacillus cellulosilyticus]PWV92037.1 accessory gene regulator B [Paenibacillus cellulosilyticus]QKS46719.1 accessory gene regulator B family protein [Paenibacillus cellulosilyticus]